jgi:hypothetical protein
VKLLTQENSRRLLANGRWNQANDQVHDFRPVVKLFTPWTSATWLLTELDPDNPDIAFGLCDLGQGAPELGYVRISELAAVRGPAGLKIERDTSFRAARTLQAYANEAHAYGRIRA